MKPGLNRAATNVALAEASNSGGSVESSISIFITVPISGNEQNQSRPEEPGAGTVFGGRNDDILNWNRATGEPFRIHVAWIDWSANQRSSTCTALAFVDGVTRNCIVARRFRH
jgi:hypothetical protein